jgi:glycosyltransferase involved in cell wall biosynthesis
VVNGGNGYLVPPPDAEAHAQAILNILNSPTLAQQMGNTGLSLVQKKFNWEREEAKLLRFYQDLLR